MNTADDRTSKSDLDIPTSFIAIAMFLIGVVSIISILLRDNTGPSEIDDAFLRIGGMSLAAGIVVLCRTAEKYQPAI